MVMAALQPGCQRTAVNRPAPPVPSSSPSRPSDAGGSSDHEGLALVPAARCGECHGQIEAEWRRSAHAHADSSPSYQRMRAALGAAAAASECDTCHAPLRRFAPHDVVNDEGVSCDSCHMLASVAATGAAAQPVWRLDDNVRYGPICDAQPHYFHRMGCAPWFRESHYCATCHDGPRHLPSPSGSGTLFPEYEEWRDEYSAQGSQDCQVCHMPATRREVALGSPERTGIREHSFRLPERLLGRALSGQAHVSLVGASLRVVVTLTNSGAGHAVPSGLPERRVQIGVVVLDASGQVRARDEHSRGRVLVDAAGHEAPFFLATRVERDTRIRPGKSETDVFELPAVAARKLQIFVRRRLLAPAIWARLGGQPLPDEPMLAAELTLPPTLIPGPAAGPVPARSSEPVVVRLAP